MNTRCPSHSVLSRRSASAIGKLCAILAFLVPIVSWTGDAGAQGCLSAAETRNAIASGQVIPLASVSQSARSRGYSELASVNLCGSGGSMVYQVVAVDASGRSARLVIDGASGAVLSER